MKPPAAQLRALALTLLAAALSVAGRPGRAAAAAPAPSDTLSLAGTWRFELDPQDQGLQQRWFARALSQQIPLPGSVQAQRLGDPVRVDTKWTGNIIDRTWFTSPEYEPYRQAGNIKVPFWLQPDTHYTGVAWYQRQIEIPSDWKGRRLVLHLERPHWETQVWLDDGLMGINDALATPHDYDLGTQVAPGTHRLTVRVDNRLVIDVGIDSHSVSDHTQGNWNGIVGRIELQATAPVWIEDLQVYPRLADASVTLRGRIGNHTGQAGEGKLLVRVDEGVESATLRPPLLGEVPVVWQASGGTFDCTIKVPSPKPWDEFTPVRYVASAWLAGVQEPSQAKGVGFGFREITTRGTQFLVNGRPIFLRGTLECSIFPKTGHPPTDLESWRKVIRAAKAHGLNNLRFHSHCPPAAAFDAADELGMYLQVECSSWANSSTTLGDGKPVDAWIYREADRILETYGNHPSFVLLLYGNEPGGPKHVAYLKQWVEHYKAKDPRRLYSSGAGWPQLPENQFHVTPDPRIQGWGQGLKSRINAKPPETQTDYRDYVQARPVPVISHEIGQWCVYPNFAEIPKYTGYLKPKNFDIFRDRMTAHHLEHQARDFLFASGKLQTLCYKEDIESALRTPGMGGFQLLDLHDFPGQGTALVGVLDPFWESKGYVSPEEFRRFCNTTVPLARLAKRVFTTGEILTAELEVAHFGPQPLVSVKPCFKLVGDDGSVHLSGQQAPRDIPVGNGVRLDPLNLDLRGLSAPARYRLVVGLQGTSFENDWDIWVYPSQANTSAPAEVRLAHAMDDETAAALRAGQRVLLLLPPEQVSGDELGRVELGFSTIFWNTAWTRRQPPHTMGILCDPRHPALSAFPTDGFSNWQWWYLVSRASAMILDALPRVLQPTVQVIDDWVTARKLGLLFEAKVGPGRLMVCSIDLEHGLEANLVARQFRHSLLQYMRSDRFAPSVELTVEQVRGLSARTPDRAGKP